MYEGKFPKKRYNHTLSFLNEVISKEEKILDLGVSNPFSEIITGIDFNVTNPKGEDLYLTKNQNYNILNVEILANSEIKPI
ncbi:hypothetical protein K8089_09280 [Aequorivita sp. F47161]|uniref:Uncharacterized protein n=1 Tax=Aequorivita vitellina TaxID=2874475 RepID=A0A9X1QUR0_9FLAO|nr:hypothetical protein [Aequorivita vitellina]MCG2419213.1 hypothetical protein [Aequorivita vitellina]